MSDRMQPYSFGELMTRMKRDYASDGTALGLRGLYRHMGDKALPLFGRSIETPVGPAAGPHTQMSQNIVAAYLAGARFFELKTVQTLDGPDLPVQKPCILARDEGYNVEWSTELRVEEAMAEYIRAWYACHLLGRAWRLGAPDGFVFNMSVGYDYQGITSPKIDGFIEGLRNARDTAAWKECEAWAKENELPGVDRAFLGAISPRVCESVTLSTLHGCPPKEIERIAGYLISQKKLHTFVKCNPTLLGYGSARDILSRHGFGRVAFDDTHFKGDLQWADALPMLERLQALADENGVCFGVKLSNTFPVQIKENQLPGEEMYMSGRALYPLTVELAARLTEAFAGKLRVSFSGGADAENVCGLLNAGVWPVTVATTLLKPGGYDRLRQLAERLSAQAYLPFTRVDPEKLAAVRRDANENPRYRAPAKQGPARKQGGKPPMLDCFAAPCTEGCPLHQDAPAYLALAAEGRYAEAMRVILRRNPLPYITGDICSHRCMSRCTRQFYEEPVRIREVKRLCAERGLNDVLDELKPGAPRTENVAIVGGGPAGMAAAFFLARAGARATIFEKQSRLGGMVRYAIPAFRIGDEDIDADAALLERLGVTVRLDTPAPDEKTLAETGFTHTLLCTGAWKPGALHLDGVDAVNAIEFLHAVKTGQTRAADLSVGQSDDQAAPANASVGQSADNATPTKGLVGRSADNATPTKWLVGRSADVAAHADPLLPVGPHVAVIGGGNTAMDAARAAQRLPGVQTVTLVYRRTRAEMPADEAELAAALADGVRLCELANPLCRTGRELTCRRMRLGEPDASGRRAPEPTDELLAVPADTIVAAVGERVDGDLLAAYGVKLDEKGRALSAPEGVYVLGDAMRGPATVAEAVADAQDAVAKLLGEDFAALAGETADAADGSDPQQAREAAIGAALPLRGALCAACAPEREGARCLHCGALCETCVEVCPNRANISVELDGRRQVVHVDRLCNECGNCATFCPYEGAPYRDKWTAFADESALLNSENDGFAPPRNGQMLVRREGRVYREDPDAPTETPPALIALSQQALTI